MLSDAQFAETFARSKWRQARWAPSRIRMVRGPCRRPALFAGRRHIVATATSVDRGAGAVPARPGQGRHRGRPARSLRQRPQQRAALPARRGGVRARRRRARARPCAPDCPAPALGRGPVRLRGRLPTAQPAPQSAPAVPGSPRLFSARPWLRASAPAWQAPECTACTAKRAGCAREASKQGATSPRELRAGLDQQLLGSVRRQAHLSRGLPPETRRRRLVAWLQRRGHTWGTVSALLRELHLDG